MTGSRWRDPSSRRGALLRVLLFMLLFSALNYLLVGAFNALGFALEGPARFLVTSATLLAALVAGAALLSSLDDRRVGALGFAWTRQTPRELGVGTAAGGAALALAVVILLLAGALRYAPDGGTAGMWVVAVIAHLGIFAVAAAAEEAVYRGYGFQALVRGFGEVPATLGAAAMFAVAHSGNPNVTGFALLNIFLAGVMLSVAYLRTMSLWFATAVHAGWNWAMASLFDLPVSGLAMFNTPLYEPAGGGAAWLSGGTFGPEGGIVGSIGLVTALIVIMYFIRLRIAPEMAALRPLALATVPGESAA